MAWRHEREGVNGVGGWFAAVWRLANGVRRWLFNALMLVFILALLVLGWSWRPPVVKDRTVLVLALQGAVPERAAAADDATGPGWGPASLHDIVRALDHAASNPSIHSLLLRLDGWTGDGLPTQRELAAAVQRFRAAGKKVVAWGLDYGQASYYLAAHADEVYLHPMGAVRLQAYGSGFVHGGPVLDALARPRRILRAGIAVDAAGTAQAQRPDAEALQSGSALQASLWQIYSDGVERARRLPTGQLQRLLDEGPELLVRARGDAARLALDHKLVDGLLTPDALRTLLMDRGAVDGSTHSFRALSLEDYARRIPAVPDDAPVAWVVAEGLVGVARRPAAAAGWLHAEATAERIRWAREDVHIKALVLRIDSPGGSAVGSEIIRRELQLTRAAGKPVVVSMGDVAAAGGYWMSLAADEVLADPASLTGSITASAQAPADPPAAEPDLPRAPESPASGAMGRLAALHDRQTAAQQAVVDQVYADFSLRTAAARKLGRDQVETLARARLWSGTQARARGLVDGLGGLQEAKTAARGLARLPPDAAVREVQLPVPLAQRLMRAAAHGLRSLTAADGGGGRPWAPASTLGWTASPMPSRPSEGRPVLSGWPSVGPAPAPSDVLSFCGCGWPD